MQDWGKLDQSARSTFHFEDRLEDGFLCARIGNTQLESFAGAQRNGFRVVIVAYPQDGGDFFKTELEGQGGLGAALEAVHHHHCPVHQAG
ncbi:hypothetical protein MHY01S_13710 [Meiothermus hypogaeus NBRC 106114]|uniref:Uncharacterized protein n=1 Tax=Meiothermus hypogaeus NBRC 106114 TaxID=1227553 RepID=A0A511R0Q5_9DEIN|nr:hypothetical protein MHY01S_13710 [Meiothermus hypogaeus NBRC 106114]